MQCPHCGIDTLEGGAFCHKCGAPLNASGSATAQAGAIASPPASAPPPATEDMSAKERLQAVLHSRTDASQAPQQVVWSGTFSSRAMIDTWVLCGLATIGLLVAGVWFGANKTVWSILVAAILILWAYNLLLLAFRRIGVRYQLTSQRFIHEKGVLTHVSDRIDLVQIEDLRCEQGLIERILGVGTIRIISGDNSNPALVLRGIEDAKSVAAKIDETRRAEQMRRGLLIE